VADKEVDLPAPDGQDFSSVALQNLPAKLLAKKGDPGIYSDTGEFGSGPGWYHFGTSDNQLFIGHPGEADFYVLDFGVTASGDANTQGKDTISQFERGLDGIVALDSFAEISPGVSYSAVVDGTRPHGHFDGIAYILVHLEFVEGTAVETEIADLGLLRFVDLV